MTERHILDDISYHAAEVHRLEDVFGITTQLGKASLHESMLGGAGSREQILSRQAAVDELSLSDTLRETLTSGLQEFARHEAHLELFVDQGDNRSQISTGMRHATQSLTELAKSIDGNSTEAPQSPLLKDMSMLVARFSDTTAAARMRSRLFYTPKGVRGREEISWHTPRLAFRPGFSGRIALANAAAIWAAKQGYIQLESTVAAGLMAPALMGSMFTAMMTMEGSQGHRPKDFMWSKRTAYDPLRRTIGSTPEYRPALAAVAELDLLAATAGLRRTMEANGHQTVLPAIHGPGDGYRFSATGLKNPLLALTPGRELVANNIRIGGENARLTFLTGPNSGGKSTISKAVVQNQILGQMGGAVAAGQASISMADRIAYHVPTPPSLDEQTGRFGFELRRVRQILDGTSEQSLTVLDDCLDGTTHEERLQVLKSIMYAFRFLGGATLFSTHAHEMVGEFEERQEGQFLQVAFAGDKPTYQIVPGVSHTSHASSVAQRYGFTDAQVAQELAKKGYPGTTWF